MFSKADRDRRKAAKAEFEKVRDSFDDYNHFTWDEIKSDPVVWDAFNRDVDKLIAAKAKTKWW